MDKRGQAYSSFPPTKLEKLFRKGYLGIEKEYKKRNKGGNKFSDREGLNKLSKKLAEARNELKIKIEERKKSEEELLFKNVLLEAESETSPDGILVVDEKGKSILYNTRFWKIWKIPKKILNIKSDRKMIKYVLSQLKDPKGFVKKVKYLYSHKSEKSRDEIEFKDGRVFERYSSPLIGSDGKHYGRIWYFRDISERKRAERAVSESEIKYRSLVSNIPGAVYRCACDSHWTMEVISNAIIDISGYPASDFIGNKVRSYASIIHSDDKDMVEKIVLTGVKNKEPYIIEYRIIHEDRSVKWVYEKGQGIFDKNGTLLWLDGAIFDITEKKRAEERIKIFMKEFEVSPNSQFVVEYKGNKPLIIEVNKAFLNYYGFTRKEIIGQNPKIINSGKQTKEYYEKMWNSLLNPKIGFWSDEIVNKRKDGSLIDVILTISTIFNEKNNPVFFVASHVDITKRKQMENQLEDTNVELKKQNAALLKSLIELDQARRNLEDINIELKKQNMALVKSSIELAEAKRDVEEKNIELIALASHEMKTPLTSVTSIVELMLDGNIGEINEKQKEGLKIASHDLHRLDLIINNMVDVSRVEGDTAVYEFSEFNIIDLINNCIKTAEPMLKERNIKVELKDGHYCNVNADKSKIEQVVLNLITNAIKYGNENGHIWITVKSEGYVILLEFRDDGKGISEKNISKLFNKNFQVRGESGNALGGMGYGLYLSKKILDRHKGEIWVKSELGKGSTFYVLLPIRQKV